MFLFQLMYLLIHLFFQINLFCFFFCGHVRFTWHVEHNFLSMASWLPLLDMSSDNKFNQTGKSRKKIGKTI